MKPVVFQSQADFQKSISTESKMFSIYAVGVKKGYRRETRVKVHAVVDFRNAPQLGAQGMPGMPGMPGLPGMPGTTPLPGTIPGTTPGAPALPTGATPDAIMAAMQPSTGGQVVYYRVE
jgi:general secretion pathway protein K